MFHAALRFRAGRVVSKPRGTELNWRKSVVQQPVSAEACYVRNLSVRNRVRTIRKEWLGREAPRVAVLGAAGDRG